MDSIWLYKPYRWAVAITQGAGYVTPLSALLIGLVDGSVSFSIVFLKANWDMTMLWMHWDVMEQ